MEHLTLTDPTDVTRFHQYNLDLVSTDDNSHQTTSTFMMSKGDLSPCTLKAMGVPFTWRDMGMLQRIYFTWADGNINTTTLQFPDRYFGMAFQRKPQISGKVH